MKSQKGFTIIELIVVIAIIAVLAAIVLVNVTSYINKGKDAAIKGNMASIMTSAAGVYDNYSSYTAVGHLLADDPTFSVGILDIEDANGTTNVVTTNVIATAYCVQSPLLAGGTWCVDSTGYKGANAGCDSGNATCIVEGVP